MLFGVFAIHSPESCPLNSAASKKIFLNLDSKIKSNMKKFQILNVVGFYMSVLEHEWVIILDAKSAHDIEQLCIAVGISSLSTVKIVPMKDYSVVAKTLKSKNSSFNLKF